MGAPPARTPWAGNAQGSSRPANAAPGRARIRYAKALRAGFRPTGPGSFCAATFQSAEVSLDQAASRKISKLQSSVRPCGAFLMTNAGRGPGSRRSADERELVPTAQFVICNLSFAIATVPGLTGRLFSSTNLPLLSPEEYYVRYFNYTERKHPWIRSRG
jgi:hypothetical protein